MSFLDNLFGLKPKKEKPTKTLEEFKHQIEDETAEYNRVKNLGLPEYTVRYMPGVGLRDHFSLCPVCGSKLELTYRKAHRHVLITCTEHCGYEYVKEYGEIRN